MTTTTPTTTTGDWAHAATTGDWAHAATTGDWAHAATTGRSAHAATTGRRAHAATTERCAHAATTGRCAHAATTGDWARAATTGDYAHAATTGDWAHAATTGDWVHAATTGDCAHAATTGRSAHAATTGDWAHALSADGAAESAHGVAVGRWVRLHPDSAGALVLPDDPTVWQPYYITRRDGWTVGVWITMEHGWVRERPDVLLPDDGRAFQLRYLDGRYEAGCRSFTAAEAIAHWSNPYHADPHAARLLRVEVARHAGIEGVE